MLRFVSISGFILTLGCSLEPVRKTRFLIVKTDSKSYTDINATGKISFIAGTTNFKSKNQGQAHKLCSHVLLLSVCVSVLVMAAGRMNK